MISKRSLVLPLAGAALVAAGCGSSSNSTDHAAKPAVPPSLRPVALT